MTTTTNEKKPTRITKAMRLDDIASMLKGETPVNNTSVEDALSFIAHELELLANKNKTSGEKKPTALQIANLGYQDQIRAFLADHPDKTVTEIAKGIPEFASNAFTTSKVNGLLKPMLASGEVVRTEVKGKALFKLAVVE